MLAQNAKQFEGILNDWQSAEKQLPLSQGDECSRQQKMSENINLFL